MGLTIGYTLRAPKNWTEAKVTATLEQVRQFVVAKRPFRAPDLLRRWTAEQIAAKETAGDREWLLSCSDRSVESPWWPLASRMQVPAVGIGFDFCPAEGSEPMNLFLCRYDKHVWKPERLVIRTEVNAKGQKETHEPWLPYWSAVLRDPKQFPASYLIIKVFLDKYRLRRISISDNTPHAGEFSKVDLCLTPDNKGEAGWPVYAMAGLSRGHYVSHHRGYQHQRPLFVLNDPHRREAMRFGPKTAADTETVLAAFASKAFKRDVRDLVCGRKATTPAAGWVGCAFCKTQYANDPALGGWANFAKAHLTVLAVLEYAATLGLQVDVRDESGCWDDHDLNKLAKEIVRWDAMIAGGAAVVRGVVGDGMQSAMDGRADLPALETAGLQLPAVKTMQEAFNLVVKNP